jgi:hypothetical protein
VERFSVLTTGLSSQLGRRSRSRRADKDGLARGSLGLRATPSRENLGPFARRGFGQRGRRLELARKRFPSYPWSFPGARGSTERLQPLRLLSDGAPRSDVRDPRTSRELGLTGYDLPRHGRKHEPPLPSTGGAFRSSVDREPARAAGESLGKSRKRRRRPGRLVAAHGSASLRRERAAGVSYARPDDSERGCKDLAQVPTPPDLIRCAQKSIRNAAEGFEVQ